MQKIKAITFDLDGVYFVNGKSNFMKGLDAFGVSEEDAVRVFLKSDEMNKEYKKGKLSDDEYWSWAISQWDIDVSVEEIIKLLISGYEINDEVVETVKRVRSSGYKTLVCTNNFPARINGLHDRFGFLDNFDSAVFSYEVRSTKPSKEIFDSLVESSGVEAHEIVFADDNEYNLEGAKSVGIQTFLYEGFDRFIEQLNNLGVNI